MDQKFTDKLQAYLAQPEAERDTMEGATLLLQLNRNRILFQNITRRPEKFRAKLFYELNKYLTIRIDNKTMADVARMDKEVPAIISGTLAKAQSMVEAEECEGDEQQIAVGRRADHAELPEEIQALYVENGALGRKLIVTHERLKEMNDAQPCDRYELLKMLVDLDKQIHANWAKYDAFDLETYQQAKEDEKADAGAVKMDAKAVTAARKYLSDNKTKLAALKDDDTQLAKYTTLLGKVQERYNALIASGENVSDDQKAELVAVGVTV